MNVFLEIKEAVKRHYEALDCEPHPDQVDPRVVDNEHRRLIGEPLKRIRRNNEAS